MTGKVKMKVWINLNHVIAVEELPEEGRICIVTPVRDYCAPKEKVRYEKDPLGVVSLVVEI